MANILQNIINAVQQNPQVQGVEQSPIGQLFQGKPQNFIPSLQGELSGKPYSVNGVNLPAYKPQVVFGGEMDTNPVASIIKGKPMPQETLDQFNLPKSQLDLNSPSKIAAMKNTIRNEVPGSTWTEKFNNLKPTMKSLEDQMKSVPNEKQIPISDYQNAANARLKPLVTAGKLTQTEADQAATSWLSRIFNAVKPAGSFPDIQNTVDANGNVTPLPEQQLPSAIDKNTALDMHRANNDAVKTFYNAAGELKSNLSPQDEATIALRGASGDVLNKNVPQISDLLTKQSHLFQADNVVGRLASDEQSAALKEALTPKPGIGDRVKSILTNPIVDTVGAVTGITHGGDILGGIGKLAAAGESGLHMLLQKGADATNQNPNTQGVPNSANNNTSQVDSHNGSINNVSDPVNRYSVSNDPIKTGQLLPTTQTTDRIAALQSKLATEDKLDPVGAQTLADHAELESLNTKYSAQEPLRKAWVGDGSTVGIGTALGVGGRAFDSVQKADPGFFNVLNQGYDKAMTASNGKYAQMATYLQYLQAATGTDFTKFTNKEALSGAIDASMKTVQDRWNSLQSQFSGNPTGSTNPVVRAIAPTQAPQNQPSGPKFNFTDTNGVDKFNFTGHQGLDSILQGAQ